MVMWLSPPEHPTTNNKDTWIWLSIPYYKTKEKNVALLDKLL